MSGQMPPQSSTSPLQIGRANSMSAFNRAQFNMQSLIPSSLPDHFDMSKLTHELGPASGNVSGNITQSPVSSAVSAAAMRASNMAQQGNEDLSNSPSGGLGPIARPRSYSTSNTKSIQPPTLQMLLNEKQKMGRSPGAKKSLGPGQGPSSMFSNSGFATVPEQNSSFGHSFGGMSGFGGDPDISSDPTPLGRNPLEDLGLDNFDSQLSSSLNFGPSSVRNDEMGQMFNMRRGSLLNNDNSSSPINIPGEFFYQIEKLKLFLTFFVAFSLSYRCSSRNGRPLWARSRNWSFTFCHWFQHVTDGKNRYFSTGLFIRYRVVIRLATSTDFSSDGPNAF